MMRRDNPLIVAAWLTAAIGIAAPLLPHGRAGEGVELTEAPARAWDGPGESPSTTEPSWREIALGLAQLSDERELEAIIEEMTAAAQAGDVSAQGALGRVMLQGLGRAPRDAARARHWLELAAEQGHVSAAYFFALMLRSGEGGARDFTRAAHWLEVAARKGHPYATQLLAEAYRRGEGVPQSDDKALEWYSHAADLEYGPALFELAQIHRRGDLGLPRDEAQYERYMLEAEHAIDHTPPPP